MFSYELWFLLKWAAINNRDFRIKILEESHHSDCSRNFHRFLSGWCHFWLNKGKERESVSEMDGDLRIAGNFDQLGNLKLCEHFYQYFRNFKNFAFKSQTFEQMTSLKENINEGRFLEAAEPYWMITSLWNFGCNQDNNKTWLHLEICI